MAVAVVCMAYVPYWEPLLDALRRVIGAVDVSEDEAKLAISRAIACRKIQVRVTVKSDPDPMRWNQMVAEGIGSNPNHSIPAGECFEGANIGVPSQLTPLDFDWQTSRPIKPWQIGPRDWRSIGRTFVWPRRIVSRIEARIADVTRLIDEVAKSAHGIAGESTSSAPSDHVAQSTPSMSRDEPAGNDASLLQRDGVSAPARKKKSQPQRERARRMIDILYPGGIPDQATEPNPYLVERVGDKLKELQLPQVSKDSILRAAGRRK
jgi:hypothetical protein